MHRSFIQSFFAFLILFLMSLFIVLGTVCALLRWWFFSFSALVSRLRYPWLSLDLWFAYDLLSGVAHCSADRVDKVVDIRLQEVKRCKSSSNCRFKMHCNVWILPFLYVKSYPRVLVLPILLQPQIYCHHYKIVVTSYISAGKSSGF